MGQLSCTDVQGINACAVNAPIASKLDADVHTFDVRDANRRKDQCLGSSTLACCNVIVDDKAGKKMLEEALLPMCQKGYRWPLCLEHLECQSVIDNCPQCRTWSLGVQSGLSMNNALVLTVQIGSDADGRSTWCSSKSGEHFASQDVEVSYNFGYFEIPLWLVGASTSFKAALKQVTRSRMTDRFSSVTSLCSFALVGCFGGLLGDSAKAAPRLSLKVYWSRDDLLQSEELPFRCQCPVARGHMREPSPAVLK